VDRNEANVEAAAPSRPLLLGERTLLIAQATLPDVASIGSVARKHAHKDTPLGRIWGDPVFKELSPPERLELLREAGRVQAAGKVAVDPLALEDAMMEPPTLSFAVWLLARKNDPNLRLEDVAPLITEENAVEVYALLTEASGMLSVLQKNLAGASG
jgi:hypothetical protein